jgi:hypothetical protein
VIDCLSAFYVSYTAIRLDVSKQKLVDDVPEWTGLHVVIESLVLKTVVQYSRLKRWHGYIATTATD